MPTKPKIFNCSERKYSHTGTENGPGFISQQWGILDNERKLDLAILRKL